jgi:hypothetical protein
MRIAYIASYQGPTVLEQRPIVRNRSLSPKVKTELIARLLQAGGHEVEIISHGEVIDHCLLDESMVSGLGSRRYAFSRSGTGRVPSIS